MKYNISIFLLLLSFNSITSEPKYSRSLVAAVCNNKAKKVERILLKRLDFDVNSLVDENKKPLLFRAALNDSFDVLKVLLECPLIDVNKKDSEGRSIMNILYKTYCVGNMQKVNPLNSFGTFFSSIESIVDKKDKITLLDTYKKIDRLLQHTNFTATTQESDILYDAYKNNDLRVMDLLLNHRGINPTIKNSEGVLLLVDMYNQYSFTPKSDDFFELIKKFLLHKNSDLNETSFDNESFLHKICYNEGLFLTADQNYELLTLVLQCEHIDINILNERGKTPLHKAVFLACCAYEYRNFEKYEEQLRIIEALVTDTRINLDVADDNGKTAYDIAAEKDNEVIMELLIRNNSPITYNPEDYTCTDKEKEKLNRVLQQIVENINDFEKLSSEFLFYFHSKSVVYKRKVLKKVGTKTARDYFLSNSFIEANNENNQNQSKRLHKKLKDIISLGVRFDSTKIKTYFFENCFSKKLSSKEIAYYERLFAFAFKKGNRDSLIRLLNEEEFKQLNKKNLKSALCLENYIFATE